MSQNASTPITKVCFNTAKLDPVPVKTADANVITNTSFFSQSQPY